MIMIGHVTLRLSPGSAPSERPAWGRRVERAFASADLAPRGMPPHSILIVRRLDDPLPGVLLSAARRWGDDARGELERLWRRAYRPARSFVSADAEAVWFADWSEWLACLSLDLYHGVAHLRWWWQTHLRASDVRSASSPLAVVWQERAQWLPGALAILHDQNRVPLAALANRLSPAEIGAVRRALVAAHELPIELIEHPVPLTAAYSWIPHVEKAGLAPLPAQAGAAALVVLALATYYTPAALRAFGRSMSAHRNVDSRRDAAPAEATPPSPKDLPPAPAVTSETSLSTLSAPAGEKARADVVPTSAQAAAEDTRPPLEARIAKSKPEIDATAKPQTAQSAAAPEAALDVGATSSTQPRAQAPAAPRIGEQPDGVVTALGGVWFLINLFVALDLFDDDLSPWLKLDALARRLLVDPPDDALWAALAELAGREDTPANRLRAAAWLNNTWATIETWLLERLVSVEQLALVKPARLYMTRTHIDVAFRLDDIDLTMRLIGLDRDPGWLPEFARVISFHFE